jgi:hypothetical protein
LSEPLSEQIRGLSMDEPPASQTASGARELAAVLRERAATDPGGEPALLALACARALEAAADRQVLFVFVVPLVVAAQVLLECRHRTVEWERGLAGARYEIETLLPVPDVPVSSLRDRTRTR